MIELIAACSQNRVIGYRGELPWRLAGDMRRFRRITLGRTVVMGRRTWESLPAAARPLPERRNIVVTGTSGYDAESAEVASTLHDAFAMAGGSCFVIGGASLYRDALPIARRAHVTHVDVVCDGDAFFPKLPPEAWKVTDESPRIRDGEYETIFRTYERRG